MTPLKTLALTSLSALCLALPIGAQRGGGGGGSPPPVPDIVYCNGKITAGQRPLWVMSSNGSNARKVLGEDCKYACPTLSADGLQIAFTKTRGGVSALWVVNSDGTGLHAVTPILLPVANQWAGTFPSIRAVWSPVPAPDNQRKLLFADTPNPASTPRQLFVVNLDGSGRTQLTNQPGAALQLAASYEWSQDGRRIAYLTDEGPVVADLGLIDGQLAITAQTLIPSPAAPIDEVGWANTRDQLVLAASSPTHGGNHDLWLVDLAYPLAPVRLTNTADDERLPTFSADDSAIYFWSYSQQGGTHTVWANGSGVRTQINSSAQSPYHRR